MNSYDEKEIFELLEEEQAKKKETPEPKSERENKDVLKFIKKNEVIPGDFKVPTYVIYYHYIKWKHKNWGDPCGKEEFFRTFKKHFHQKRSGNQRYYMINNKLDLSHELYEKAEKYDQKWQKRKVKKK